MTQVHLNYGHETASFSAQMIVEPSTVEQGTRLSDPAGRLIHQLNHPAGLPPISQAVLPDDRVAIVVDEQVNQLPTLLTQLLHYLHTDAHVALEGVTLVVPPRLPGFPTPTWPSQLPEPYRSLPIEVHTPYERTKLSYLATTKAGRPVYLNRTLVEADQSFVLGRIDVDTHFGLKWGFSDIYPSLAEEATRQSYLTVSDSVNPVQLSSRRGTIEEVGWLLGVPILVQVVEAEGDGIAEIWAGLSHDLLPQAMAAWERVWKRTYSQEADVVLASISGSRQTFADLARALFSASRVVRAGGAVVLLCGVDTDSAGPGVCHVLGGDFESLAQGLAHARSQELPDEDTLTNLVHATNRAKIYLYSRMKPEEVEELYLVPMDRPNQAQRLLTTAGSVIVLQDAHRVQLEIRKPAL